MRATAEPNVPTVVACVKKSPVDRSSHARPTRREIKLGEIEPLVSSAGIVLLVEASRDWPTSIGCRARRKLFSYGSMNFSSIKVPGEIVLVTLRSNNSPPDLTVPEALFANSSLMATN